MLDECYEQSKIVSVDMALGLNGTSSEGGDYLFFHSTR
jgi:hypothetical protein